ncbi:uroporphyrinogen-III synthase [Sphingomonas sp.]|uniref:uroporphyrinogen-III synthase n=1 Tax=Sphingomonas sp. TaxID=28214 RepID=UPI0033428248
MSAPLAVLRPEPGHAATRARAQAAGFETISLPLFAVQALTWELPHAAAFDALLLTSANAVRFAGAELAGLTSLPVLAVGPHTAMAAQAAGFDVMAIGGGDGAEIAALAMAHGVSRALHLTGRDRTLSAGGPIAQVIPVYESAAIAVDPARLTDLIGSIALLHSARAARRLAALLDAAKIDRARVAIAAFSPAIAAAAGVGWAATASAATPDDAALFVAARSIA